MKAINIILSCLIYLIIAAILFLPTFQLYQNNIKDLFPGQNIITGVFIGIYCSITMQAFYRWFKSNIKD